jgi:hypothetical protein
MTFLNYHSFLTDRVLPVVGAIYLSICVPVVAVQIVITTFWGGLVSLWFRATSTSFLDVDPGVGGKGVGKESNSSSNPRRPQWLTALSRLCDEYSKSKSDGDIVLWAFFMAVVIPGVWLAIGISGSIPLAIAYNIFRIGPMYMFFAHSYTLCHMEVHHRSKLFVTSDTHPFSNIFNWWAGTPLSLLPLFFAVISGVFGYI